MTERLRLEPLGPEHIDDLVRLHRDPVVAYWNAGEWSKDWAERFAKSGAARWETGVHKWMAYQRRAGALVGRGGLSQMRAHGRTTRQIAALVEGSGWDQHRLEVGWAVLSEFQGQGFATEIGRAGLALAQEVFAAESVIAFTERHNHASRRVMELLGMQYAGEIQSRGLVEGQTREHDDAPFAVYALRTRFTS